MTTTLKAIETVYNGYRFRSRLEARWAVFFDTLGIKYEYEKEGFDLDGVRYLPDFWLPEQKCWVEIKGQDLRDRKMSQEEREKARLLARMSGHPVFVFGGAIQMPDDEDGPPLAAMYQRENRSEDAHPNSFCWRWQQCPVCRSFEIGWDIHRNPANCTWHCDECDFGEHREEWQQVGTWMGYRFSKGDWISGDRQVDVFASPSLVAAYTAARQARFEHGEHGGK